MPRLEQLRDWIATTRPDAAFTLAPASADASFRRYFRVTFDDKTLIAMDAPPEHEDCRPFVKVAGLFAGVHVPTIVAQDLERGFLLLEDLGNATYHVSMNEDNVRPLYLDAIDALIGIQSASRPSVLPDYDEALLTREMALFPEWYAAKHLNRPFTAAQWQVWNDALKLILANNLAQPRVFVHRDYHCRNLMQTAERNPGVIDFQDAVYGAITYDLVSLFKDAYVQFDEEFCLDMVIRYWEKARAAKLPVPPMIDDFYRDYEWMGVQRHLKVAGIFARLCHRDGKTAYLDDIPLVIHYLLKACDRYLELRPLGLLIRDLAGVETQAGYTF